MQRGPKSPGIVVSGLMSCAALALIPYGAPAYALKRNSPAVRAPASKPSATWTPDNGDGTFTNPLFYDEFSDPDLIRVGNYFYLTGTTMHAMPGLPILRSKDLVNWEFVAYALDKLDLGPAFGWRTVRTSTARGYGRRPSATMTANSTSSRTSTIR